MSSSKSMLFLPEDILIMSLSILLNSFDDLLKWFTTVLIVFPKLSCASLYAFIWLDNFSMFFQDYIPSNPNYKVHLNLLYGTGLSFGPPQAEKYKDILRIPDYRRVDIGFSAVLKAESKKLRSDG